MSSDNPGAMPVFLSIGKVISFHPATHLKLAEPFWLLMGWLHLVSLSLLEAHLLWRLLNWQHQGENKIFWRLLHVCIWVCGCADLGSVPLYRGLKSIEELWRILGSLHTASNLISAWSSIFWPLTLPHSFFCSLNTLCTWFRCASTEQFPVMGMPFWKYVPYFQCKTQLHCQSLQETIFTYYFVLLI